MTVKFTDLPSLAAVDIADDDVLAVSDISAAASKKVTVADLLSSLSIAELTQLQVENPASTVFGQVSGERLDQKIVDRFNLTGTAPTYACRAWVNFNGTGVVAIRASGNVSSITDNGTGDYTVNFTTAMPDADYSAVATTEYLTGGQGACARNYAVSSVGVTAVNTSTGGFRDSTDISASIFR
jgi:hypothetical protein